MFSVAAEVTVFSVAAAALMALGTPFSAAAFAAVLASDTARILWNALAARGRSSGRAIAALDLAARVVTGGAAGGRTGGVKRTGRCNLSRFAPRLASSSHSSGRLGCMMYNCSLGCGSLFLSEFMSARIRLTEAGRFLSRSNVGTAWTLGDDTLMRGGGNGWWMIETGIILLNSKSTSKTVVRGMKTTRAPSTNTLPVPPGTQNLPGGDDTPSFARTAPLQICTTMSASFAGTCLPCNVLVQTLPWLTSGKSCILCVPTPWTTGPS